MEELPLLIIDKAAQLIREIIQKIEFHYGRDQTT